MFKVTISAIFGVVILSGCTITPEPLKLDELQSVQESRMQKLMQDQEPVTQYISLYEAMARAIKYNLDYKVELFEEALRASELKLSKMSLLPKLVASAGLNARDKLDASRSRPLLANGDLGDLSELPSTSSDKSVVDASLQLSWDILDFGLSYARAKQNADRLLIAEERKRKVINRVIANVRTAFWRAASAERLVGQLKSFEQDIEKALASSEATYQERKTAPLAALTYQRELLEIQNQIHSMEGEMKIAKMQLAALMNLDPSVEFQLAKTLR